MATCGILPPLSTSGRTFIFDPLILNTSKVKSYIELTFHTSNNRKIIISKNFQLSLNRTNDKYQFRRLEQNLKTTNSNNEPIIFNQLSINMDKQVYKYIN